MSIKFTITHQFDDVSISKKEFTRLLKQVSWKEAPSFLQPGRTAWCLFEDMPNLKDGTGCVLSAAKLKGVGIWNPQTVESYSGVHANTYINTPIKPNVEEYKYTATTPHLGFDEKGQFTIVYSDPSPYGGMTHERAIREFNNALTLYKKGIHSTIPFVVVEYEEKYTFQEKRMGAVISLSPVKFPYRVHNIIFSEHLEPEEAKYWDQIRLLMEVGGSLRNEITRLKMLKTIGSSFGRTLRGFAEAGLYRHSGGLDNIFFCTQCQRVVLTDLDSSRSLDELPPNIQALQVLRDITSVLYKFLYRLGHPLAINQYTLNNLIKYNPLTDIIIGYFPEVTETTVQQISERLLAYFAPHFFILKKYQKSILQNQYSEMPKYHIDRNLFYVLSIISLSPLLVSSNLISQDTYEHDLKQLMENAKCFLGEQYEYLIYLLSR